MMSAHDTLYWHCWLLSTAALALRMAWNPSGLSDWLAVFRHSSSPFEFTIMIDASQPCIRSSHASETAIERLHALLAGSQQLAGISSMCVTMTAQSWKKSLSAAGAAILDCAMDCLTEPRTMVSRLGQVLA